MNAVQRAKHAKKLNRELSRIEDRYDESKEETRRLKAEKEAKLAELRTFVNDDESGPDDDDGG